MDLECSVVIPAYDAAGTIGEQLAALATQESPAGFEVVVADNGSRDDLAAAVEPWRERLDVRVVDASARRGPSAARNIGVRHARAGLLLFCDADDVVAPRWVRSLVDALATSPFAGGPCRPFADRTDIWMPGYDTEALPVAWDDLSYAFAGNLGVTREAFDRIGGFDETLTGAEEIDFAWRARGLGVRPAFVPAAEVRYRIRPSLAGRLRHEFNSGRGTMTVALRTRPQEVVVRSPRGHLRHMATLASRFPRSTEGARWAAWAAVLAYGAGARAAQRGADQREVAQRGATR